MGLRSHRSSRREAFGEIPGGPYISRGLGPVYGVTGTLVPDATCNYFYAGIFDGRDYLRRADGNYFIWWSPGSFSWFISAVLGIPGANAWQRVNRGIVGAYNPLGAATGVATVQVGVHP